MIPLDRFQPPTRKEEMDAEQAQADLAESQSADPILNSYREQQQAAIQEAKEKQKTDPIIMDEEDAVIVEFETRCRFMVGRIDELEKEVKALEKHLKGR